jgi:hypothetical protein
MANSGCGNGADLAVTIGNRRPHVPVKATRLTGFSGIERRNQVMVIACSAGICAVGKGQRDDCGQGRVEVLS